MGKAIRQMRRVYRLKFYVNASHAVRWENGTGQIHPHTWEIMCEVVVNQKEIVPFDVIEKKADNYFEQYQGKLLNEVPPFDQENPTLENITEHIFEDLNSVLLSIQCTLSRLEVGESPTRVYCISTD